MRWGAKTMLEVCPVSLKEANAFVEQHHRHHKPVVGHKFSIACTDGEKIVGVAIVGRPVSRYLDDGWTLEVNRLCTDGTKNACSMLYAAAWRAALDRQKTPGSGFVPGADETAVGNWRRGRAGGKGGCPMQILINLAVLAVALTVVATLACIAAGDGR